MKQLIAILFLSFCPFITGICWVLIFTWFVELSDQGIVGLFILETVAWLWLFVGWFDGSKYQHSI